MVIKKPEMKLLSVNVGRPRTVEHRGRAVRTAIFKEPVHGRVRVERLNVEGDRQADLRVHGGPDQAVYAYDLSGYEHWRRELSRPLPYGQFGENLTVQGLPETAVSIGDAYRVGGALLQVTQPRVPCYKLAMRMELPDFGKAFLASGRTGFYMRVLEEGETGAGDPISLEAADPARVAVAEMTRLLFSRAFDGATARRALEIESLSEGLRKSLEERLRR
jgi:MOSC domain-containing protein YiiM